MRPSQMKRKVRNIMNGRTPKTYIIEIILPPAIAGLFEIIEGGEERKTMSIADTSAASQFSSKIVTVYV